MFQSWAHFKGTYVCEHITLKNHLGIILPLTGSCRPGWTRNTSQLKCFWNTSHVSVSLCSGVRNTQRTKTTIRMEKERQGKWPSAGNIQSNIAYNWRCCTSAKLRSGTILVTLFWLIFFSFSLGVCFSWEAVVLLRNICSSCRRRPKSNEAMLKKSRKMRIYRLLVCRNALETNSSRGEAAALLRWILSCPNPNRKRPLRWKIP